MTAERRNYVIHTPDEIVGIRKAATQTATVLDKLCRSVRPGMTSMQLDDLARDLIAEVGGISAFLNSPGPPSAPPFPGHICISINDEVVHGFGSTERVFQMGDLISIDCGIKLNGFIGDTARTVSVGPPVGDAARLMDVTRASLMAGIEAAIGGKTTYDIGGAIWGVVKPAGFTVVRDFVGHGVGVNLHEKPEVPNYPNKLSREKLRPGMVLALEPMVNAGKEAVKIDPDRWTVRTRDGSLSAHFEHMILITENKPEILTWPMTQSE